MKKRYITGIVLACALSIGCAAAVAAGGGTSSDPLVNKNYLDGTYLPAAYGQIEARAAEKLASTGQNAEKELQEANERLSAQLSGGEETVTQVKRGGRITAQTGAGILVVSGTFRVSHSGAVVDMTVGAELASGSTTTAFHRYLAAEGTTAVFTAESEDASVLLQGGAAITESALPFLDVKESDWFYASVRYVYEAGLFNGTDGTHFSPTAQMNRGMLATVLYRLAGSPEPKKAAAFQDVASGAYYAKAVAWASEQGIVTGVSATEFAPDKPVTREQMAAMLYRYAGQFAGLKTDTSASLSGFSDGNKVSSYAKSAMQWAVGVKIIQGSGQKLNPAGNATRAEVAAMLQRFSALLG